MLQTGVDLTKALVYVGRSETRAQTESFSDARRFFNKPGRIHLIQVMLGEESAALLVDFERTLYRYGTDRNELYHCRMFGWQGIRWSILSIPARDEERAQNFLGLRGRMISKGARYDALTGGRQERFPFSGENFRLIRHEKGLFAVFK